MLRISWKRREEHMTYKSSNSCVVSLFLALKFANLNYLNHRVVQYTAQWHSASAFCNYCKAQSQQQLQLCGLTVATVEFLRTQSHQNLKWNNDGGYVQGSKLQ